MKNKTSLTHVVHGMHAALREDGHLSRRQGLLDDSSAVLLDHVRASGAFDRDNVVARARVIVRWEHCAGSQIEHCH